MKHFPHIMEYVLLELVNVRIRSLLWIKYPHSNEQRSLCNPFYPLIQDIHIYNCKLIEMCYSRQGQAGKTWSWSPVYQTFIRNYTKLIFLPYKTKNKWNILTELTLTNNWSTDAPPHLSLYGDSQECQNIRVLP